ncbi:MAG TPA: 4-hydroxy-3-methylbut-2-enyl diphosphate reductase [Bacteroidales bacterium]|nr:4-hydroxy-3-methylbut-2-enyl diphosphate reductase [Bacteroidales bacterium]
MIIEIDQAGGFCFGVEKATRAAEDALSAGIETYCLGQMVHNPEEIKRLRALGLREIEQSQLPSIAQKSLIFRAHGEPPETYEAIRQADIKLIDATCPVVLALQKKIKAAWLKYPESQIVIFGKPDHPEIIGLNGNIQYQAIVVSNPNSDLDKIDFSKPVVVFSQTTQSQEDFDEIVAGIADRLRDAGLNPETCLRVERTICRQVSKRVPALKQFASSHDVIVFVCGVNSSNGKYLFSIAKSANPSTYMVESEKDLQKDWFEGATRAGISGATSTPRWQLEKVANAVKTLVGC